MASYKGKGNNQQFSQAYLHDIDHAPTPALASLFSRTGERKKRGGRIRTTYPSLSRRPLPSGFVVLLIPFSRLLPPPDYRVRFEPARECIACYCCCIVGLLVDRLSCLLRQHCLDSTWTSYCTVCPTTGIFALVFLISWGLSNLYYCPSFPCHNNRG